MRLGLIAITLLAFGLGGWLYAMQSTPSTPRRAAIAYLRSIIPPEADSTIILEGCSLRVTVKAPNQGGMLDVTSLSIDLRLFNTGQTRISQLGTGHATYLAPRVGINDAYLDQGLRLIQAAPDISLVDNKDIRFNTATSLDRETLSYIMNKPNAKLLFGLSSSMSRRPDGTSTEPQPSSDAPAFNDFVDRITALDPPATFLASRRYLGADIAGDKLLTGAVRLPGHIEFAFPDRDIAAAFAKALHTHRMAACG